jgi:dCTP diphosphatase
MELQALKTELREFAAAREWDRFHTPKNLAMALAGEAGEVLEIFQWLDDQQSMAISKSDEGRLEVGNEIADVLIYLIRLADVLGIDIDDAVTRKIGMNASKYPIALARGNAVKYSRRVDV